MINSRAPRHRSPRQRTPLLAALLAAALPHALSFAAVDTWNAPISANFSTGPWSPGVPAVSDTALFSLNNTYTVTFDTNPTNASFAVTNGAVTWITNGSSKAYTVTSNSSITGGSLSLGASAAALAVNLSGTLTINGAAAPLLNVAGTNNLTAGNLFLGTDGIAGHSGTITDSSNITLFGASTLTVGAAANSTGNLTISAGSFTTGTGLTSINATGQVNLAGASFNANGDILLNGGTLNHTGGAFNWAASHTLTIQNAAKFNLAGSYATPTNAIISVSGIGSQLTDSLAGADFAVNNGAQLTAASGALVSSTGFFDVGSAGVGTAIIDGAGTSLTVTSGSNFLGVGGIGTLSIRNNANATTGGFIIGQNAGSTGTLNLQSNATLITGPITVSGGNSTAAGNIVLAGGTITQTGTNALTLGSAVSGSANLSISSGTFNTSAGTVIINATGLVNITGGTFNLNGSISVAGGNLTQANSTATFSWAPGHLMTITANGKVNLAGVFSTPANAVINVTGPGAQFNNLDPNAYLAISNGAQLNVTAGAHVSTGRIFDVGDFGTATAIFDGPNSSLTAPATGGQADVVGNGGTGTLTFRNNATGSISTGLVVGAFGGNGTLNVQSGASLTAKSLDLSLLSNSTGNANITGGSLVLSGSLSVGDGGAAALTIGSGGSLFTGNSTHGDTSISPAGSVLIAGGTLLVNGNITLSGGTFLQNSDPASSFQWVSGAYAFTVQNGANATLQSAFSVPGSNTLTVTDPGSRFTTTDTLSVAEGNSQLNVLNGATLSAPVGITITATSFGNAVLADGAGSSISAGPVFIDGASASAPASLTLSNFASASFTSLVLESVANLTLSSGATLSISGTTALFPGTVLTITDASASLGTLSASTPILFNSGSLSYIGNLTVGFGGILGTNLTLDFSRALTLSGTTTITPQHQLSLTGGSLSTGALVNNGSFNFSSGSLAITGPAGLTIGNGGPLGASLSLFSSQTLSVSNTTIIAPTGLLFLNGGNVNAAGGLTNNGTIQFASPASSLTGNTITNNGTIQGTGFVAAPVNNSGTIEPTGGNLLFTGAFNNTANGTLRTAPGTKLLFQAASFGINQGLISLAGGTLDNGGSTLNNIGQITGFGVLSTGGPGLGNNGNITFTGGTSTINGNVTNNPTHTINVKFQPAIFTGNVTNNANATIKTTSTTATFAGSFQNFGNFLSDPATNIFQGPTLNAGLMSGGPGDVFTLDTFTNTGTFTNGGSLNANNNITNAATFSQSGPQTWSPGTTFTNTNGTATFQSNAKLYGLTISAGTVDITTSKFIIEATTNKSATLAALQQNLTNHSLTSSTLPANYALALVDNALLNKTSFGNNPADPNSLLLSAELLGDANIDGTIDLSDLSTILNHFGAQSPNWTDGNFDHTAQIDLTDLSAVLNNFGQTNPNASTSGLQITDYGLPTPTPEPTSLLLLLPVWSSTLKRRRSEPHL